MAVMERRHLLGLLRMPKRYMQACDQFFYAERFGHVIISAHLQGLHFFLFLVAYRKNYNRYLTPFSNLP